MIMRYKWILGILLSLIGLSGCYKYETINDGPYDDSMAGSSEGDGVDFGNYSLMYLQKGDIYGFDPTLNHVEMVFSANEEIWNFQVNSDHTRIAYQTSSSGIEVIDLEGNSIESYTTSFNTKVVDWHPDNKSVIAITGGIDIFLCADGKQTSVPYFELAAVESYQIDDAAILPNGDLLYCIRYEDYWGDHVIGLALQDAFGFEWIVSYESWNENVANNMITVDSGFSRVSYQYQRADNLNSSFGGYEYVVSEVYNLGNQSEVSKKFEDLDFSEPFSYQTVLGPDGTLTTYDDQSYNRFTLPSGASLDTDLFENITKIDW